MITSNYDLDIDSTLGGDNASDYVISSQKAIKSYVDNNTGSTVDQVYDPTSQAAQSGIAIAGANFLTSSDLTDYVTTNTDQNITGVKTFVGQKMIAFKQASSSNKLGFTLYNNNNVEKGYLEFNPTNTIDGAPLMTLGNYATAAAGITHVGFRKYSSVSGASGAYNLLAPLISNAKTPFNLTTTYTNFYLPLGFTDGTTMVKTANTGVVDLSSILPDISEKQDSSTAVTHTASTAVGSSTTPVYVASDGKATALSYTIEKSVPSNAVFTDTTYSDFTGADSITAGANGLVPAPSAGDEDKILTGGATWNALKTINNTSILGSGNIDVLQNTATDNTSISILGTASNYIGSINIGVSSVATNSYSVAIGYGTEAGEYATAIGEEARANEINGVAIGNSSVASAQAATALGAYAGATALGAIQIGAGLNSTASTLSVGFSGGSNYQMLDGTTGYIPDDRINPAINTLSSYVAKSGDTMTGGLRINDDRYSVNGAFPTSTPSSNTYLIGYELYGNNTRLGLMGLGYYASGKTAIYLQHERTVSGTIKYSALQVGIDDSGNGYASCPKPQLSSDTNDIATTNWVNDKLYYRAGDKITSLSGYAVSGYLTSSKTRLSFTIPLPKSLDKVNGINITAMTISARQGTGGYVPSDGWNAKSKSTITTSFNDNMLHIECYSTSAFTSFTNNINVVVAFGTFTATFT